MAPHSVGPEPGELSRAISELDLTSLRGDDGNFDGTSEEVETERGPRYSRDQLLSIRSKANNKVEIALSIAELTNGTKTPPAPPRVPPPTPEYLSVTPGTNTPVSHLPTTPEKPEEEGTAGEEVGPVNENASEEEPKKKKKKKSSGKTKKPAPTGFEEFYADPPIAPDEYEEECEIYSETRPFAERIETCIQRYRARRKLDSARSNILTKYWGLGGIESSGKTFNGGLDKETLENSTAAEIAAIQATDFIRQGNIKYYDPDNAEHWVVDWEGVAKGFLSWRAPTLLGDEESEITLYCAVVRNFLNYVLTHNVCPEYSDDVMAARKLCDIAEKELKAITYLRSILPGDFNMAASTIYGGMYQDQIIANEAWAGKDGGWASNIGGLSKTNSEFILKGVLAMVGKKEHYDTAMKDGIYRTKTESRAFEVVSIERASKSAIKDFSCIKDPRGLGALKPIGKIYVKHWEGRGINEEDMSDDENAQEVPDGLVEEFWLEDEILQHCYSGLKLELVVHELNINVKYFDEIEGIYPSFHSYLPNEKMAGWKEPVPNERPPPTEDDPDAEEKIMDAIADDESKEL